MPEIEVTKEELVEALIEDKVLVKAR